jgi:hypothetical protein
MQRLASDAPLRARLAAGARADAEGKGWEAELDRLDGLVRTLREAQAR